VYVDNSIIFSIQSPLLPYSPTPLLPYSPTPDYTITIQPDLISAVSKPLFLRNAENFLSNIFRLCFIFKKILMG
ncbi:MAG: hypothetical protein AB4080_08945, partial [Trichodesmium sp.]